MHAVQYVSLHERLRRKNQNPQNLHEEIGKLYTNSENSRFIRRNREARGIQVETRNIIIMFTRRNQKPSDSVF